MSELYKRNIHGGIEYASLSLLSHKIDALVIGGGRAGFIKTRSLVGRGISVTLVSTDISEDFNVFEENSLFRYEEGRYREGKVDNYHMVVIAVDGNDAEEIRKECDDKHKLYIDCTDFKEGNVSMTSSFSTDAMHCSVQTRGGSPKTSRFMSSVLRNHVETYDGYVDFSVKLRNSLKGSPDMNEIMDFVSTEDFLDMYLRGKGETIINTFYGGKYFEIKDSDKKE